MMQAHKLALILLPFQLLLPLVTGGWSIRYALVSQILVGMLFLSGFWLFARIRKRMRALKRIYLWMYPAYTLLLLVAYIGDRIFFVICMMPLWFFLIPQTTYFSQGQYSITGNRTVLGRAKAEVYTNSFIFHKRLGEAESIEPQDVREWKGLKVIDSAGAGTYVSLQFDETDTLVGVVH